MLPRIASRSLAPVLVGSLLAGSPVATLAMAPPALQQAWSSPASHLVPLPDLWGDGRPRALGEEAGQTKVIDLANGDRVDALPLRYGPLSTMTFVTFIDPLATGQYQLVVLGREVTGAPEYLGVFEPGLGHAPLTLVWEMQPVPLLGVTVSRVRGGGDDLVLLRSAPGDPGTFYLALHEGTTGALRWDQETDGIPGAETLQETDVTGEGVPDWLIEVRQSPGGPLSSRLITSAEGPFVAVPGGGSGGMTFGVGGGSPNPFASETRITYTLAARHDALVRVFDPAGRLVRTLARGPHEPGPHVVTWDGRNDAGRGMPSGVYLYEVQSGPERAARRIIRLR